MCFIHITSYQKPDTSGAILGALQTGGGLLGENWCGASKIHNKVDGRGSGKAEKVGEECRRLQAQEVPLS